MKINIKFVRGITYDLEIRLIYFQNFKVYYSKLTAIPRLTLAVCMQNLLFHGIHNLFSNLKHH